MSFAKNLIFFWDWNCEQFICDLGGEGLNRTIFINFIIIIMHLIDFLLQIKAEIRRKHWYYFYFNIFAVNYVCFVFSVFNWFVSLSNNSVCTYYIQLHHQLTPKLIVKIVWFDLQFKKNENEYEVYTHTI